MAITVPPDGWFHGIARALFDRYRQALVDLGVAVFDVPVDAFLPPDVTRVARLVADLRAFRPQCALGLPHGSYALLCRLPVTRRGVRPNLFLDILDVPTICLWDHAPVELADQLLTPHPRDPSESTGGAIHALRRVLAHPRLIHWSRDSGQARIMRELGFLDPDRLITEMPPALPGFERVQAASTVPCDHEADVAFVGRVYQDMPAQPDPALAALADEVVGESAAACTTPFWYILRDHIEAMPTDVRARLALDRDQRYFWRFAHELTCHQGQTSLRLKMLGAAGVPVACYGNLRTDLPIGASNLRAVPCSVPYGPELARLFARHPITIDVLSPGFVNGFSHKQLHGFTSGGFMLINWKRDFVEQFGDAGAEVSFAGPDDLATKVERFLVNPRYRREVGDAIRATIAARCQLKDSLARALIAARQCEPFDAISRKAARPKHGAPSYAATNLLPTLESRSYWCGARVEHDERGAVVTTSPQAWAYAAIIDLPARVRMMREPHFFVRLLVEEGRIGVALVNRDGEMISEQIVSQTLHPFELTVELPRAHGLQIILRNIVTGPSRARVLEAQLCHRVAGLPEGPRATPTTDAPVLSAVR